MDIDIKYSLNSSPLFFGSLILRSAMLRAVMSLSLSIPSYSGQPAKRSFPEAMIIDGDGNEILALNTSMDSCSNCYVCLLTLQL